MMKLIARKQPKTSQNCNSTNIRSIFALSSAVLSFNVYASSQALQSSTELTPLLSSFLHVFDADESASNSERIVSSSA